MAKYSVTISQRAFTSIFECVSFLKKVSIESAEELYKEMMNSIKYLSSYPDRNPKIANLSIQQIPIRRMIICNGRYAILYKVNNNDVFVYDVLDNRRDNKLFNIL